MATYHKPLLKATYIKWNLHGSIATYLRRLERRGRPISIVMLLEQN